MSLLPDANGGLLPTLAEIHALVARGKVRTEQAERFGANLQEAANHESVSVQAKAQQFSWALLIQSGPKTQRYLLLQQKHDLVPSPGPGA